MTLADIARATGAELVNPGGRSSDSVLRIATDSREVREGDLFVAIRGDRLDGHDYVKAACDGGASACLCDRRWYARQAGFAGSPQAPSAIQTRRGGNDLSIPALVVSDTVEALGKLAAHYRRDVMNPATIVIAITGTNGKTTTKAMLDHLLSPSFVGRAALRSFNNAIGVPLTILSADPDDRYLIVEIGSSAPGEVDALARIAMPNAAIITSIGEAHLEGLVDLAGVVREKAALLDHVRSDGLIVVNVDQPQMLERLTDSSAGRPILAKQGWGTDEFRSCSTFPDASPGAKDGEPMLSRSGPRVVTVGTGGDASLTVSIIESDVHRTTLELDGRIRVTVPMPGRHHATNAAAAFAVARWFGIPPRQIIERLSTFVPLEGRTRSIALGDIQLIDDAYNANPASMSAVVEALAAITEEKSRPAGRRRVLVMGDMLELGDASAAFHERIVEAVMSAGIEVLVAVGPRTVEAADRQIRLGHQCESPSRATRVIACDDAADAATKVADVVQAGDVVWVKGSRGIGLDRVVTDLAREFRI